LHAHQILPTLKQYILTDGFRLLPDFERSEGPFLADLETGEKYLDFCTFYASMPIGYNHPALKSDAFREDVLRYCVFKPSNPDFYSVPYARFVERLASMLPDGMRRLFFIDTGALAVENAMKAAFDWKAKKNLQRRIAGGADQILYFQRAFHGRSGYALSATDSPHVQKTLHFPRFDWPMFEPPVLHFPSDSDYEARVKKCLYEIDGWCHAHPDQAAALIVEPIQGEGGDRHFGKSFFEGLRGLADEHEFLLIFDEVQSGMGLTGRNWAHQHFAIQPDILVFGKKAQVCGIAAGPRIDEVPDNVFRVSSRISGTWCGSVIDYLRGALAIGVIQEERLVENATARGETLLKGLEALEAEFPFTTQARGRGLMAAIDLPDEETTRRVVRRCYEEEKMLLLTSGTRTIRFRPVLDVTDEVIEEGLRRLRRALEAENGGMKP
jgi:L-lysine 6-transaminase